jgi:DNA-binding IclR family transcriptional regulator
MVHGSYVVPVFGKQTPKTHRTVSRVTAILELAAANPEGISLIALAAALDAAKSSIHGFARGLVAEGYLQEEGGRYFLGPAVASLLAPSDESVAKQSLLRRARSVMVNVHLRFNETVMLSTQVGDSAVYEVVIESNELIRYSAPLNVRRPLYPTSSGKCFLAYMTPAKSDAYFSTIALSVEEQDRVKDELRKVRAAGFALNRGETLPDITGAAAPVFSHGKVVACVAVAGPSTRFAVRLEEAAEAIRQAARSLSDLPPTGNEV